MPHEVVLPSGKTAWVTNIMADGTEVDDLTGYVVPYNERTAIAYDILLNAILREIDEKHQKEAYVQEP